MKFSKNKKVDEIYNYIQVLVSHKCIGKAHETTIDLLLQLQHANQLET